MDIDSSDSEELLPISPEDYQLQLVFDYTDPASFSGILKCVIADDLPAIIALIKKGRSPNVIDNLGNTPLHVACYLNRLLIIDYLLSLDETSINAQNFDGETALLLSVSYEKVEAVEKLLLAKADASIPNNEDVTPLHMAARKADPILARLLLQRGNVDIDAQDYSGDTALNEAVKNAPFETVAMLLYYNADATIPCINHLSPFMNAIIRDELFIQQILLEYETDFSRATDEGMSTLFLAVTHGTPIAEEVVLRGADLHYCNNRNILQLCIEFSNINIFRIIWNKTDYKRVWNMNQPSILKQVVDERKFDFFDHIIESDQLTSVIESMTDGGLIADIFRGIHMGYSKDRAVNAVHILLASGYNPDEFEVEYAFSIVGYCPLFTLLLHMDITSDGLPLHCTAYCLLPAILVCVNETVDAVVNRFLQKPDRTNQNRQMNLRYIAPFIINRKLFEDFNVLDYIEVELKKTLDAKVPSLLELSRNELRLAICSRFSIRKCSQFYTIIKHMNMPLTIKHIINFQVPIY